MFEYKNHTTKMKNRDLVIKTVITLVVIFLIALALSGCSKHHQAKLELKEMGNWIIDAELKQRDGHKYYVCKHRCNPSKVELVFVRADGLSGKKELCDYLKEIGV